jgi:hypothetical protein
MTPEARLEELLEPGATPAWPLVEEALTAGYGRSLQLEAERLRVSRRLVAIGAAAQPGAGEAARLARLWGRLDELDRELGLLRARPAAVRRRCGRQIPFAPGG